MCMMVFCGFVCFFIFWMRLFVSEYERVCVCVCQYVCLFLIVCVCVGGCVCV